MDSEDNRVTKTRQPIPKMVSTLGFFYIGRMLTLDVDFLPTYSRGKNQNERNRSGRHELHRWAPGQRRHKGYRGNPLTRVE
jgi:hypothetical protein